MSRRRRKADELANLAAELGGEDGSDPKDFHAKPWEGANEASPGRASGPRRATKQATRKGRQLCAQVKDALHAALAGCADPVLQSLAVLEVQPAPHTGRLRVIMTADDRAAAEAALRRAAGFLRAEVAAAINRRYTPELVFEVM
jgi:ribosome-binding factor A